MPDDREHDFSGYLEFTAELRALASKNCVDEEWTGRVNASLDGAAGAELQRLVSLSTRRAHGAFFTGSLLAERLLGGTELEAGSHFVFDPTVGAGDLLLSAARRFRLGRNVADTLTLWGASLAGTDIRPEFVDATKLRIALLARQRHGDGELLPRGWKSRLPNIRCGDGLKQKRLYARASHLLMNPPFTSRAAIADCAWTSGKVSDAGLFVFNALKHTRPDTHVLAILPDVLHSGSFQDQWREQISNLAEIRSVERYGIFDNAADVDVFILDARRRRPDDLTGTMRWPTADACFDSKVGDHFDVHVGRVVPHRDKEIGAVRRYIHPRNIPVWKEVKRISEKRRHKLVYKPPFVVIRRTSRPGHQFRAAATVILGKKPVAVENHLIVCEPRNKSADSCRDLMRQLRSQSVNAFLDQYIRCRHLTVGSVEAIPFSPR